MDSLDNIQRVALPEQLSSQLLDVIRKKHHKFQRINKEEEPPLRMLDHGLYGEYACLSPQEKDPNPYVLRSGAKCYHAFRFDQDVCDEKAHDSEFLCSIHGEAFYDNQTSFRQILSYSGGVSSDSDIPPEVRDKLKKLLLPAALKIYGEEKNAAAWEASELFSIYTNLLIPGNTIKLHVDTPDFAGLDRSRCPSWLLAVAHCSGQFSDSRVRNVTCVCYPQDANGGELSLHAADNRGCVFPVRRGTSVVMNADSIFHQVAKVKPQAGEGPARLNTSADLPAKCYLEVEERDDGFWWIIRDKMSGAVATEVKEDDIRFSVSCKFHIFHDLAEAQKMKSKEKRLTAEHIIDVLTEDLKQKNKIPRSDEKMKLFDLAPILVSEYILPLSPSSADIERVWKDYFN